MNAYIHSQISVKKRGGKIEDYYEIHDFSDSSKEVESSNCHRLYFHTMWGVKNLIIPIFGHTITNSDGKEINVKDLCENDHILPDYTGKFIPTLTDFVDCIAEIPSVKTKLDVFYKENQKYFNDNLKVKELLMSPLWNTGKVKSLLITHNSWFVGSILPRIFKNLDMPVIDYSISPSLLFNNMSYENWMQNGIDIPPSCVKLNVSREKNKVDKPAPKIEMPTIQIPRQPVENFDNSPTYDGSRGGRFSGKTID
jgi:hypothetical protein